MKYSPRQGPADPRERAWFNVLMAVMTVFGVSGLLQWIILSPGSTVFEVAKGIEIAALFLSVGALLRWAKLRGG
jgi:hypothetical protein